MPASALSAFAQNLLQSRPTAPSLGQTLQSPIGQAPAARQLDTPQNVQGWLDFIRSFQQQPNANIPLLAASSSLLNNQGGGNFLSELGGALGTFLQAQQGQQSQQDAATQQALQLALQQSNQQQQQGVQREELDLRREAQQASQQLAEQQLELSQEELAVQREQGQQRINIALEQLEVQREELQANLRGARPGAQQQLINALTGVKQALNPSLNEAQAFQEATNDVLRLDQGVSRGDIVKALVQGTSAEFLTEDTFKSIETAVDTLIQIAEPSTPSTPPAAPGDVTSGDQQPQAAANLAGQTIDIGNGNTFTVQAVDVQGNRVIGRVNNETQLRALPLSRLQGVLGANN